MYDITPIFEAVAALIAALITAFVIPYIKSKTTAEQQKEINAWVKIAVAAAEQIYVGSGRGEEKKAYVIDWLRSHGITVDEEKLDALIEAAVYELNQGVIPIEGIAVKEGEDCLLYTSSSPRIFPPTFWKNPRSPETLRELSASRHSFPSCPAWTMYSRRWNLSLIHI